MLAYQAKITFLMVFLKNVLTNARKSDYIWSYKSIYDEVFKTYTIELFLSEAYGNKPGICAGSG